jgi:hypothetical protein
MAKKLPASQIVDVALVAQEDSSLASHLEVGAGKEGGLARQRLLEGVLRTIGQASAQKKDEPSATEMLPDDLLGDELVALLRQRGLVAAEEAAHGS